jgi:hypothetical protein
MTAQLDRFDRPIHKVVSETAMDVDVNETRGKEFPIELNDFHILSYPFWNSTYMCDDSFFANHRNVRLYTAIEDDLTINKDALHSFATNRTCQTRIPEGYPCVEFVRISKLPIVGYG